MGRFVKNKALSSGSYAIQIPVGSDIIGPQFPQAGQIRYNETSTNLEVFFSDAWHGMALVGRTAIIKDSFVGNGIQTNYTLVNTYDPGHEAELLVFVGNVFQNPGIAYTINLHTITFSSPPDNNMPIIVLQNFNSTKVQ